MMADLYGRPEHVDLGRRAFIVAAPSLAIAAAAAATVLVDISLGKLQKER